MSASPDAPSPLYASPDAPSPLSSSSEGGGLALGGRPRFFGTFTGGSKARSFGLFLLPLGLPLPRLTGTAGSPSGAGAALVVASRSFCSAAAFSDDLAIWENSLVAPLWVSDSALASKVLK